MLVTRRYQLLKERAVSRRQSPIWLASAALALLLLPIRSAVTQANANCIAAGSGERLRLERVVVDSFYSESPLRAGDPRVGIMANNPSQRGICTIGLFLADPGSGTLCVRVVSRDARFSWLAHVRVAAGPPGLSTMTFQTRNTSLLSGIDPRDLAILASAGPTCGTFHPPFVVGTWGATPVLDTVRIMVNTNAMVRNVSLIRENGAVVYRCNAVLGITFQMICVVPTADGRYVLRREDAGGRRKPDVLLSFVVP